MNDDRRYIFLLNRAQRRLQRHIDQHVSQETGVSAVQAGVLFLLRRADGMLSGELAQALDVAPSAMTALGERMEKAELVEKRADTADRRGMRFFLTAHGMAVANESLQKVADINDALTEGFSEDELRVVSRWLQRVVERF